MTKDTASRPEATSGLTPLKTPLGSIRTDEISEKVFHTVADDTAYARFAQDPLHYLVAEGIARDGMAPEEIIGLIQQLRYRAAPAPENPHHIGATDQKKAKKTQTQWNFDNDKQYIAKVEGGYWAERGRSSKTDTQELMQKDEGFKAKGMGAEGLERLIFDDDPDFFPGQPLVTPALFDKIRDYQKKS